MVLFGLCFVLAFVLTELTPMLTDDFNYAFGWQSGQRIRNLHDLYISMAEHRYITNGRVFSHGFVSLFTMFPRWVFSLSNALMITAFFLCVHFWYRRKNLKQPLLTSVVLIMLVWICMPAHGQVFFWLAGACNYIWGLCICAWVLYLSFLITEENIHQNRRTVIAVLLAFIAGAWSEHISFAMLIILLLTSVREWKKTEKIPLRLWLILVNGGWGYLFLWTAHSMMERWLKPKDAAAAPSLLSKLLTLIPGQGVMVILLGLLLLLIGLLSLKKSGARRILYYASIAAACLSSLGYAAFALRAALRGGISELISRPETGFLLAVTFFFFSLAVALNRKEERKRLITALILAAGGFSVLPLLLFSDYLPARSLCVAVTLCLISGLYLMEPTLDRQRKHFLAIVAVCFALCFAIGIADIIHVHKAAVIREQKFREAAAGDKKVELSPLPEKTKYSAQYGQLDLVYDAAWPNGVMADYYEVIRIVVVDAQSD